MALTDTKNEAPQVDLFDGTGITSDDGQAVLGRLVDDEDPISDAGVPDAIDEAVGAGRGYLAPYTLPELLLPADDDSREAAVFDRMYLPLAGEKPVYVDTGPGSLEPAG